MNSGYEESLDKNFGRAYSLCTGRFSHEELFEFLKNGNMPEKQFAALEISKLNSQDEADILMNNLTGCDGKIREAVAFKISELIQTNKKLFYYYPEIFADATIDINANICRTIIECLNYLKDNSEFAKSYTDKILMFINDALETLDSFNFRDKKYTINKQLFKLYWCLEGVNVFFEKLDENDLIEPLARCAKLEEYTIREKVALVLKHEVKTEQLINLKKHLKSDSNYYVKNVYR